MSTPKITVTIAGPIGSGKSILMRLLNDALTKAGAETVDYDDDGDSIRHCFGAEIHILQERVN